MSIIKIEGFKVYDSPDKKSIIINSDCIKECMEIYYKYKLDGVAITAAHDYKLQNVEFLAKYPNIKQLSISDGIKDIDAIHSLSGLQSLMISGKNRKIDFAHFPVILELICDWSTYFLKLSNCTHLQNLLLYSYNPKNNDRSDIANLSWIKKLEIVRSNLKSLNILSDFNKLEELSLYYRSKLEKLCYLDNCNETLRILVFDHCKSIINHDYASQLQGLEVLAYNNSKVIPSINFIKKMTTLKRFRFLGTDVEDGDVSACIGLEYAAFTNKKHFSHTMEQVNHF